ncbi:UDP-N-acetylglucosamine 4,6-dehydratase (inverting) [Prochlorococcus sp. AH-716-F13]|nr:UDP-N-acetylglucosamine 4,6-dehydratase (inverting) [Prochlorococcus sp. AH-716-F13]
MYSRDELKQWEIQQKYPKDKYPQLRFFLGDVRDLNRLQRALEGIDTVIHAAALKQVPAAEYNPMEFIKTNVLGAENIIQASMDNDVKRVIGLSTDKAASPVNIYGATKLCSDKLLVAANNIKGERDLKFSVVRYGNVMGSRGSVIPLFLSQAKQGCLRITDPDMTRFSITLKEGVKMVNWAIKYALGGEIFVPKIPSYKVDDVAEAIGPSCSKKLIGIRPGEKIHEEMISSSDTPSTIDLGKYFAILPNDEALLEKYKNSNIKFSKYSKEGSFNSKSNSNFLKISEIRNLIVENIDKNFQPI